MQMDESAPFVVDERAPQWCSSLQPTKPHCDSDELASLLQRFASDKATVSDFVRAKNLPQTFNTFMSVGVAGWRHPNARVKITKVAAEGLRGVTVSGSAIGTKVGRWGGPARDLLPNTSVPFSQAAAPAWPA